MADEDLEAELELFNAPQCDSESGSLSLEDLDTKTTFGGQPTIKEDDFQENLWQIDVETEHRTSSPVDFRSFVQSSILTGANNQTKLERSQIDLPAEDQWRLLGEIAYQLDKRILTHVFRGQRRFYGFTVLNIPHKIIDVSTHPLTGRVDEGYRIYLSERYDRLTKELQQHGFKPQLHPVFTEFIVNTYGILKRSPAEYRSMEVDLTNPDFLRRVILTRAPTQLQKDLLVVLTCLCYMGGQDKKPLLLWSSKVVN